MNRTDLRLICVVGARRSGTHWMQRILQTHPDVVGIPGETYLFSDAIAPLVDHFQSATPSSPILGRTHIERDALIDHVRGLTDAALNTYLEAASGPPEERRLLERTPDHVHHIRLIAEMYPSTHFVHIIRDGRRVVRSLLDQKWGPTEVAEAAAEWSAAVEAGRRQGAQVAQYTEVVHHVLKADPEQGIRRLFEQLGLEASDDHVARATREAAVVANTKSRGPRPPLSGRQQRALHRHAGDLLEEFRDPSQPTHRSWRARARRARPPDESHWIANNIHASLHGATRALESLREARPPGDLEDLVADDVSLRLVSRGVDHHWRGAAELQDFLRAVREWGVLARHTTWSAEHSTIHLHVFVLAGEGDTTEEAVVVLRATSLGITEIAIYGFSSA